jgi:TonB family protein
MLSIARAAYLASILVLPSAGLAQTGPSDPEVITAGPTAKISVGNRKLEGHVVATVRVGEDGRVREVLITENTAESTFEPMLVKVIQSARFRPAIDAAGKLVEGSAEIKIELRPSTAASPKPVAARADSERNEKERERIRRMTCADFTWEWDIIRDAADSAATTEFMPRIATTMYAAARTQAGDYVDAKVWKASAKAIREAADRCGENPGALFWQDTFRTVMDEAVPK